MVTKSYLSLVRSPGWAVFRLAISVFSTFKCFYITPGNKVTMPRGYKLQGFNQITVHCTTWQPLATGLKSYVVLGWKKSDAHTQRTQCTLMSLTRGTVAGRLAPLFVL